MKVRFHGPQLHILGKCDPLRCFCLRARIEKTAGKPSRGGDDAILLPTRWGKERRSDAAACVNFPREAEFTETNNFTREIGGKIGRKRDGHHGVFE